MKNIKFLVNSGSLEAEASRSIDQASPGSLIPTYSSINSYRCDLWIHKIPPSTAASARSSSRPSTSSLWHNPSPNLWKIRMMPFRSHSLTCRDLLLGWWQHWPCTKMMVVIGDLFPSQVNVKVKERCAWYASVLSDVFVNTLPSFSQTYKYLDKIFDQMLNCIASVRTNIPMEEKVLSSCNFVWHNS